MVDAIKTYNKQQENVDVTIKIIVLQMRAISVRTFIKQGTKGIKLKHTNLKKQFYPLDK